MPLGWRISPQTPLGLQPYQPPPMVCLPGHPRRLIWVSHSVVPDHHQAQRPPICHPKPQGSPRKHAEDISSSNAQPRRARPHFFLPLVSGASALFSSQASTFFFPAPSRPAPAAVVAPSCCPRSHSARRRAHSPRWQLTLLATGPEASARPSNRNAAPARAPRCVRATAPTRSRSLAPAEGATAVWAQSNFFLAEVCRPA